MTEEELDSLLPKVKRYLRITWTHDDEDIKSIIEEGNAFLISKSGFSSLDYAKHHTAMSLLKDYCRYAWNHSLELFSINFRHDILSFSISEGVRKRNETTSN